MVQFCLTYDGSLQASGNRRKEGHVHQIRKHFHKLLKQAVAVHPVLKAHMDVSSLHPVFPVEGVHFQPVATEKNTLICHLDIMMLRTGRPGRAVQGGDIDNRLKTLFDALRMPIQGQELSCDPNGEFEAEESCANPFYVLLEDDNMISAFSIQTEEILELIPDAKPTEAARLFIHVTLTPSRGNFDSLSYHST